MRTRLREYSYLYLLAAASSIAGVGAFSRGSWGFTLDALFFFVLCLIIGSFASWKFWKIHSALKAAEMDADANATASQNQKIAKELNEA